MLNKDLSKICNYYNENCEKSFVYIDKDTTIAELFLFVFDESKFDKEKIKIFIKKQSIKF